MIRTVCIFVACLLALCGTASAEVVFHPGDHGHNAMRIPVACSTGSDALLLLQSNPEETSGGNPSDVSAGLFGFKLDWDGRVLAGPFPVISGTGYSNPSLISNPATGRVDLVYSLNASLSTAQVFAMHSLDGGLSWSSPTDVTSSVVPSGATMFCVGPNTGLRLADGVNLHPIYTRLNATDLGRPGVIRQLADGVTFTSSVLTATGGIEPAVFRDPGGAVRLDCRYKNQSNQRLQTTSTDGGITWTTLTPYTYTNGGPPCGECQASAYGDGRYAALVLPAGNAARSDLTLLTSTDGNFRAADAVQIFQGYAAYSTVLPRPQGGLLVVAEVGKPAHYSQPFGSRSWAHHIESFVVADPWRRHVNPNPDYERIVGLPGGVTLALPPPSDEAAYYRDMEATVQGDVRDGLNVGAVRDRGAAASLWRGQSEHTFLRLEDDPALGMALRLRPDQWRSQGGMLLNSTPVDYVHQTGKFSIYIRFSVASPWPTSNLNQVILDNSNFGNGDGFVLMVNYAKRVQLVVNSGGTRINADFTALGTLDADARYDLLLSCDGPGTPVNAWLQKAGSSAVTAASANLTGTNNTNAPYTNTIILGNRNFPTVCCPFNGSIRELLVSPGTWGQTEFDRLSQ